MSVRPNHRVEFALVSIINFNNILHSIPSSVGCLISHVMAFVSDLKTPVCFMPSLSLSPVCVCTSRYLLYFHFSLLLLPLCLSVCSPAAVPPCSPVWIVCLLLLLTSAIQTSSLPHSFLSALETLIHHLTVPFLTNPLLHCAHHLSLISLFLALILSLIHLLLKTPLTTITLPPSTTPV